MENKFFVGSGVAEESVTVLRPVQGRVSKEDALNLIAWLAVLLDLTDSEIKGAIAELEAQG